MVLEKINDVNDIKNLSWEELEVLSEEIREFLIEKISITGGHLAPNLGVVELTMALHLSFDLPADKIVWDVGHQAYTHKILTGRKTGFDELRKYGGMSGFPKRKESDCDAFDTGHSSTSISAAMGLVNARDLRGEKHHVIAVIGDGALTGGMAYEALNNASHLKKNFIIVLNDNKMSISENLGGMSKYLNSIRTADAYNGFKSGVEHTLINIGGQRVAESLKRTKDGIKQWFVPGMLFENMGIKYLGPVDGHDINAMRRVFNEAKRVKGAVIVHVLTKKGCGYEPAEKNPSKFHGTDPFVIETGLPKKKKEKPNYTDVFSTSLCKLAEKNENVVAITAAMPDGTGLKKFASQYPSRFFDVGIAEEHAVTFAAGLAAGGMTPVVAVYSSFLQRAYDQIVHDVCIQNLHVIFAIDRAGLVGSDGETHQGIFDLSFLASIPNLCIMAPKNKQELYAMLKFAVKYDGPIAIRYPRGEAYEGLDAFREKIVYGKAEMLYKEQDIALMAVGSMVKVAEEVRETLKEKGLSCTLINARFVKEFDKEMIGDLAADHKLLVTLEENVVTGGFGERVVDYVASNQIDLSVEKIALPDMYVEHGNVNILYRDAEIDAESVVERILSAVKEV
ncbi:MAG: 1-deoxy-D-xylulose-5-phosphate synthase [Lachnospiraceae bacterium]|nr:1-deoxy-D-xylulose-5-phosphate synthase [Lachnospiraceae bacterium]